MPSAWPSSWPRASPFLASFPATPMRRLFTLLLALCLASVAVPVTARAQATPPDSAALDSLRAEVVRLRGFLRAAETQATKVLSLADSARARRAEPAPDTASTTPPAPVLQRLNVTEAGAALDVGASAELSAWAIMQAADGLRSATTDELRAAGLTWTSAAPGIATVSASAAAPELATVRGDAAGETTVRVCAGALCSTAVPVSVRAVAAPPDTTPEPPPAPPVDTVAADPAAPAGDSAAVVDSAVVVALPERLVDVTMPASTRTIRVPAGVSLQAAVDTARAGDELVLDAGTMYVGTLTLRARGDSGWVVIRTAGTLPPEGTRVTPAAAPQLARLVATRATDPVVRTAAGARGWRLVGLEITADSAATQAYTLVSLGDGNRTQDTDAEQPHHLVLDRVYIHGTPRLNFQRCVALNSAWTAIVDSWLSECHGKGMDSQAIGGWNGTGPYKIVNNRLEAAGENLMFGGADPAIPGGLPRDIEIRRNHFIKPPAWKGVWSVKNLLELKIGQRVLIEGNVFENCWLDAQTGFALLFKSTDQGGRAPWSQTSDVTVRRNIIRNSAHGISLAAKPESYPAVPASRFLIEGNVLERIGTGDYPGGRLIQVGGIDDLQLVHNTAVSSHSAMILTQGWPLMQRLVVRDNIFAGSRYGISGDGAGSGTAALDGRAAPGWVFAGNVVSGIRASDYPAGNLYPSTSSVAGLDAAALAQLLPGAGADLGAVQAATAGVVGTP